MRNLTICGIPIAAYAIVTPENPAPAVSTAAAFLQRVIATSCGVTLPITTVPTNHSIMLGTREPSPEVKWDGFRVTCGNAADTANLYLDGNIPRGTLYAAYDFAETYLGYRSFAADCEIIPTEGEADVPRDLCRVDNPVFEARRHSWFYNHRDAAYGSRNRNTDVGDPRFGGAVPEAGCHTFHKYCPPEEYFDEHPEYFALYDGKRVPCGNEGYLGKGQLCLTNPDTIRIVTENVLRALRERPNTRILDLSQCDNGRFCECDACRAVEEEEGSASGCNIRFVNAVAEAVEEEFPHVLIRTFAYQKTRKAPKHTRARHNVLIRYCTIEACFRHPLTDPDCTVNKGVFEKELAEWGEMCSQMSIWNYGVNYTAYTTPFPNLISLRENYRFFADCGAIHLYEEDTSPSVCPSGSAYPELKAYLIGKLQWNPYMSEGEYRRHMDEFLRGYYGKGWEEIRRYIEFEHRVTSDVHIGCFERVDIAMPFQCINGQVWEHYARNYEPKPYQPVYPNSPLLGIVTRMEEAEGCFDRAEALAETEEQKERIRRNRMPLTYLRLFCTEHDKSKMSEEEQKRYEAEVTQYLADKERYGFRFNLWTGYIGR